MKFNRIIGLKSTKVLGELDFGIRAKKKVLEALWIFLERKKCCTVEVTVCPMMLQDAVKKAPLKPSGPGELFSFREKIVHLISSGEGMEVRKELSEGETLGLLIWKREGWVGCHEA